MAKRTKRLVSDGAKTYTVRGDRDYSAAIEKAAAEKGWTVTDLHREAVRAYLKMDSYHRELGEFEERQAASYRQVTKEMRRVRNDFQVLIAFFDLFVKSYFAHTAMVPAEAIDIAAANGKRRYENLLKQIPDVLNSGAGLVGVTNNIDSDAEIKE